MISRYDRENKTTLKRTVIIFFIAFSIINYFFGSSIRPYIANSLSFIVKKISPLDNFVTTIKINFYDKANLLLEKDRLENENIILLNKIDILKTMIQNASDTEEFLENGETDILIANSITPKNKILYNNIILNKGFTDEVKVGDLVFVNGLLPVGKIKEIYGDSSVLELFSANNNKIDVYIVTASTSTQVLENASSTHHASSSDNTLNIEAYGDGAYNFVAAIPDNITVNIGDKIYMREFSNYSIGEVLYKESNENEKINKVYIKSNFDSLVNNKFYIKK